MQIAQDKLQDEVKDLRTQNLQLSTDLQLLRIIHSNDDLAIQLSQ